MLRAILNKFWKQHHRSAWSLTSHLTNHPSKTGKMHELLGDVLLWTCQCKSGSKNLFTSVLSDG